MSMVQKVLALYSSKCEGLWSYGLCTRVGRGILTFLIPLPYVSVFVGLHYDVLFRKAVVLWAMYSRCGILKSCQAHPGLLTHGTTSRHPVSCAGRVLRVSLS